MNKEKMCIVVGISSYEKDGKTSYTVQLLGQYSQSEKEAGALGYKAISEWTRLDLGFLQVGDVITPIYDKGFQDKAVLGDVIVHRDLKDNPLADLSDFFSGNPYAAGLAAKQPEQGPEKKK